VAPDLLTASTEEEVDEFLWGVLRARREWMEVWTERLREWFSAKVLRPLVAAVQVSLVPVGRAARAVRVDGGVDGAPARVVLRQGPAAAGGCGAGEPCACAHAGGGLVEGAGGLCAGGQWGLGQGLRGPSAEALRLRMVVAVQLRLCPWGGACVPRCSGAQAVLCAWQRGWREGGRCVWVLKCARVEHGSVGG